VATALSLHGPVVGATVINTIETDADRWTPYHDPNEPVAGL
jgi:hypothetical protein